MSTHGKEETDSSLWNQGKQRRGVCPGRNEKSVCWERPNGLLFFLIKKWYLRLSIAGQLFWTYKEADPDCLCGGTLMRAMVREKRKQ